MINQYFPKLIVIDAKHSRWQEATDYISQRYAQAFSAHIHTFMPRFMALVDHQKILSLCGIRSADEGELFLEQYLDEKADVILSQTYSTPITRDKLIEFGQLASFAKGMSPEHFYLMTRELVAQGYQWCIFTATDPLFSLMKRLGLEPTIITEADPNRICNARKIWGTYYEHQPRILVGNLKQGLQRLQAIHARISLRHLQSQKAQ